MIGRRIPRYTKLIVALGIALGTAALVILYRENRLVT